MKKSDIDIDKKPEFLKKQTSQEGETQQHQVVKQDLEEWNKHYEEEGTKAREARKPRSFNILKEEPQHISKEEYLKVENKNHIREEVRSSQPEPKRDYMTVIISSHTHLPLRSF